MKIAYLAIGIFLCGCSVGPSKLKIDEMTSKAAKGDLNAQFELAEYYETGTGVATDFEKALNMYTDGAEQGHVPSQTTLGYLYQFGKGVPKDAQKALYWGGKAAEQGDVHAQHNLGLIYDEGVLITEDNATAMKWYKKASDGGFCPSAVNLGVMYYEGEGTPQNDEKAWNILNDVRFRCPSPVRWRAVGLLDKIKEKLGVSHPGGINRFSYPEWNELQKAAKK